MVSRYWQNLFFATILVTAIIQASGCHINNHKTQDQSEGSETFGQIWSTQKGSSASKADMISFCRNMVIALRCYRKFDEGFVNLFVMTALKTPHLLGWQIEELTERVVFGNLQMCYGSQSFKTPDSERLFRLVKSKIRENLDQTNGDLQRLAKELKITPVKSHPISEDDELGKNDRAL
jgi:hypothetical protein